MNAVEVSLIHKIELYSLLKERIFCRLASAASETCFDGCSFGVGQSKFFWKLFSGVGEDLRKQYIAYVKYFTPESYSLSKVFALLQLF